MLDSQGRGSALSISSHWRQMKLGHRQECRRIYDEREMIQHIDRICGETLPY